MEEKEKKKKDLLDKGAIVQRGYETYHGMELPSKFKIGGSGCVNSCAESFQKGSRMNPTEKEETTLHVT